MSDNETKVELNAQEVEFIVKVIQQLSISPATKDAMVVVQIVQSIMQKFSVASEKK